MENKFYSQEALNLYKESCNICHTLYDPVTCCIDSCKYANQAYCKAACLQEQYNVVNLQTLKSLDIKHYVRTKDFCIVDKDECNGRKEMKCNICLLEALVKDPYIKFIKKENINEK